MRMALFMALVASTGLAQADERLEAARQSIVEFDWKRAIKLYPEVRDAAPVGGDVWLEATYCLATAYHHVQPPDAGTISKARSLYQEIIDHAPGTRWSARAMYNIGRILELRDYPDDQLDMDGAREWYDRVVREFPDQPIAGEAVLRSAAVLVMSYDAPGYARVKQGIALLESWLASHPDDPLASLMWQYLGDSYFRPLADYDNAIRCYEQTDRLGWVDAGNQGPWYWRCAQIAERHLNRPDLAAKYYSKIIVETPKSGKAYQAMLALRRLGRPVPSSPLFDGFFPTTREVTP
jgi:tetratricopeptide (TPR) repeat protein